TPSTTPAPARIPQQVGPPSAAPLRPRHGLYRSSAEKKSREPKHERSCIPIRPSPDGLAAHPGDHGFPEGHQRPRALGGRSATGPVGRTGGSDAAPRAPVRRRLPEHAALADAARRSQQSGEPPGARPEEPAGRTRGDLRPPRPQRRDRQGDPQAPGRHQPGHHARAAPAPQSPADPLPPPPPPPPPR